MCVRDVIVDCANVHECGCMWQQVRASARCVTVFGVKSRHYHKQQTTYNSRGKRKPIESGKVLSRALEAPCEPNERTHRERQHASIGSSS